MLARSVGRVAENSARVARHGSRACISSFVGECSSSSRPCVDVDRSARRPEWRPSACGVRFLPGLEKAVAGPRRYLSSARPPVDAGEHEDDVDVTPVGDKPGQITREAIAEAEAAQDLGDDDIFAGNPSDWDYDASTEEGHDEDSRVALAEDDDEENPTTPILDAYERSRDPAEMERLIARSFESLPERAGPQRYNHKRREHQRYKTIRNIKYKEQAQRAAAYERKLQKRRDRKTRDLALFATWRGTGTSGEADAIRS